MQMKIQLCTWYESSRKSAKELEDDFEERYREICFGKRTVSEVKLTVPNC